MDVDVARLAARRNQHRTGRRTEHHVSSGLKNCGMSILCVALLAQHRPWRRQQRFEIRAVRVVAVEAALAYGRVLEQEGPALFGMAAVTDLIDAVGLEKRRGRGAVWIVTVHAADFALKQGHV